MVLAKFMGRDYIIPVKALSNAGAEHILLRRGASAALAFSVTELGEYFSLCAKDAEFASLAEVEEGKIFHFENARQKYLFLHNVRRNLFPANGRWMPSPMDSYSQEELSAIPSVENCKGETFLYAGSVWENVQ